MEGGCRSFCPLCPLAALRRRAHSPPRQVNGVLGGSAVLSVNIGPPAKVKEIEWSFRAGPGPALLVALFRDGKFERPDPSDRFRQRLDLLNETLRIKALELNDSGLFGARVKLLPAIVEDQLFQLTVYEPVPAPRIQSQLVSSTPKWCNVTLQCLSPGKGPVNVTWRKGSPIRDLGGSDQFQVSPDGRTLRLSLRPAFLNTTYSCMASNPIEHKIAPLPAWQGRESHAKRRRWPPLPSSHRQAAEPSLAHGLPCQAPGTGPGAARCPAPGPWVMQGLSAPSSRRSDCSGGGEPLRSAVRRDPAQEPPRR
uniref:Ig-like domain-containing protein n=1 Tax=Varanus komodoensis TaxID=61221 RepID=A0A8D2L9R9_VARKO